MKLGTKFSLLLEQGGRFQLFFAILFCAKPPLSFKSSIILSFYLSLGLLFSFCHLRYVQPVHLVVHIVHHPLTQLTDINYSLNMFIPHTISSSQFTHPSQHPHLRHIQLSEIKVSRFLCSQSQINLIQQKLHFYLNRVIIWQNKVVYLDHTIMGRCLGVKKKRISQGSQLKMVKNQHIPQLLECFYIYI